MPHWVLGVVLALLGAAGRVGCSRVCPPRSLLQALVAVFSGLPTGLRIACINFRIQAGGHDMHSKTKTEVLIGASQT